MNNLTQKQLVLQETFECLSMAMEDLIGHASDLESVGFDTDGEIVRILAGQIENTIHHIRERHRARS